GWSARCLQGGGRESLGARQSTYRTRRDGKFPGSVYLEEGRRRRAGPSERSPLEPQGRELDGFRSEGFPRELARRLVPPPRRLRRERARAGSPAELHRARTRGRPGHE